MSSRAATSCYGLELGDQFCGFLLYTTLLACILKTVHSLTGGFHIGLDAARFLLLVLRS